MPQHPPAELRPVRPLDSVQFVHRERNGKRLVVHVTARVGGIDIKVPIIDPVEDCEVARTADGRGIVVLAGGIRESLDLYFADATGGVRQFRTQGGRRLASSFNGDLGSWPYTEGLDLVLFAYERDGTTRFRALDLAGHVHAARELPLSVTGFHATAQPDRHAVRVEFRLAEGFEEPLVFPHPAAARLLVAVGRHDFGDVQVGNTARHQLELSNPGGRALDLASGLSAEGFRLVHAPPTVLQSGQRVAVEVEFRPARPGPYSANLELRATGAVPRVVVPLAGIGVPAPPIAVPLARAVPPRGRSASEPEPEAARGTGEPARGEADPLPVPSLPSIQPPPPLDLRILHGEAGTEVRGRVPAPARGREALRVAIRNLTSGVEVVQSAGKGGRFEASLPIAAGDRVAVAALEGEVASEWVGLTPLPPTLSTDGKELVLRARRGEPYLLCAVVRRDGGPQSAPADVVPNIDRALRVWRGQAGTTGEVRLQLDALDGVTLPIDLVLLVDGPSGSMRSVPLTVAPH